MECKFSKYKAPTLNFMTLYLIRVECKFGTEGITLDESNTLYLIRVECKYGNEINIKCTCSLYI